MSSAVTRPLMGSLARGICELLGCSVTGLSKSSVSVTQSMR